MGGRAALSFAAKHPDRLNGLILESTTAGIKEQNERLQRTEEDNKLAEHILAEGIDKFINDWYNKPLFNSIGKNRKLLDKLIKGKKNLSPTGLANSLKGFSTGLMKNHWAILEYLNMPVMLITGEDDVKFSNLNGGMAKLLPDAMHHTVRSAGHNVHLENEREFVILLNSFLRKL
jgi:2-succinyl-6-hydroxy-2,4-cyclohexadiene-1-carboxylate synthase